ncbi:ABC transporter permease subunit [Saccharopolyspora griseoalba]|uniref:ABC transporter permease subunit n=1 Tax=Saccharopolyspora griseoalba TaxID=1431848 RepID=A0ABW2LI05_9PSEU
MVKPFPIFRRSIAESRRAVLGWAIGLTAFACLYLPLFPTFGGSGSQMAQMIDALPPTLVKTLGYQDIASGAGYAQSTFFGLMGFVLTTIAAISWGAAAIAGAEETGRLELTLAHGVSRTRQVLEASASVAVRVALLGLFAVLLVLALNGPSELELVPINVLAAGVALASVAFLTGAVALAVGAATGRHAWATIAGAIVAIGGYATNAIANQSADLDWLHAISPYAWAWQEEPLESGWPLPGLSALWIACAVLVVLTAWSLNRRDLRS